jgi:hypothetical protein
MEVQVNGLITHIKETNTLKKLTGDYIFYSTDVKFWQEQNVETIEQFEHWCAKQQYEAEFRRLGNKGFLPFDPDELTTAELQEELEKLGWNNGI